MPVAFADQTLTGIYIRVTHFEKIRNFEKATSFFTEAY